MSSTISSSTPTTPTTTTSTGTTSTGSTGSTSSSSSATSANSTGSSLVTSTGIGSGLNISGIVSALTTAFGAGQQDQINTQSSSVDSQVSAWGTFTSSIDALQTALGAVDTASSLAGFDAAVGDKTIASATAASGAVAGTYTLAVQNLATSQTLTSSPVSGATTAVGTGTLQISVGNASTTVAINSSDDTLQGIASAINSAANNPGVSASVISGSDGQRLVLSGTASGAANAITITETDGGTGLSSLTYDPADTAVTSGLTQTQAAQDANFTLNGFAATSASNTVTGALTGVTINLTGASQVATAASGTTPATYTPTTLTITPDATGATTAIGSFVTALNSTLSTIQSLTSYNPSTGIAGPLQGNATLEAFQTQLENTLDKVTSSSGGVNSLADLGITADANTGQYDSSASTLSNALTSSLSGVESFLTGTNGLATQLNSLVTQYTQAGGVLSIVNDSLQTDLKNISTQQTQLNTQLAAYSATLTTQYNAMDAAVAALKETQTYLTAEFDPNSSSSSSQSTSNLSSGTTSA
jgi:flagellar hook-associated protein 2